MHIRWALFGVVAVAVTACISTSSGGGGAPKPPTCTTDMDCPIGQGCSVEGDGSFCAKLCTQATECAFQQQCPTANDPPEQKCKETGVHTGGKGVCDLTNGSGCFSATTTNGNSSGSTFGATTCAQCVTTACSNEYSACRADTACAAMGNCLSACPVSATDPNAPDSACAARCPMPTAGTHSADLYDALSLCGDSVTGGTNPQCCGVGNVGGSAGAGPGPSAGGSSGGSVGSTDTCSSSTTCSGCTGQSNCGFCDGSCVAGSAAGPDNGKSCNSWQWTSNSCSAGPTVDPCSANTTCDSCVGHLNCGFCNGECVTGTQSGPSNGQLCGASSWQWIASDCSSGNGGAAGSSGAGGSGGDSSGTGWADPATCESGAGNMYICCGLAGGACPTVQQYADCCANTSCASGQAIACLAGHNVDTVDACTAALSACGVQ